MRNARILALLVALCLSLASLASAASVGSTALSHPGTMNAAAVRSIGAPSTFGCIYCLNGFYYGNKDAWTINYGYEVSNTFTSGGDTTMLLTEIASWEYPGDWMTGIGWAVGTSPGSGNIASGFSETSDYYAFTNSWGYDIYVNAFNTGPVNLGAGTYWLTLYNATTAYGNPAYWDMNSGPSRAWESEWGYVGGPICRDYFPGGGTCSDAFVVLGNTPEPGSLMLLGSGLLGLGAVIRRRLGR